MSDELLISKLASIYNCEHEVIANILALLQDNATVAFIARYRKHLTNNMDELTINEIANKYHYLVKLAKRKEEILANLAKKGVLTLELENAINQSDRLVDLESLYEPYATNKKTRASIAYEANLLPLAELILTNKHEIDCLKEAAKYVCEQFQKPEAVLLGVCDIIAEKLANDIQIRDMVYVSISEYGTLITKAHKTANDVKQKFAIYYQFTKPVRFLQAYQLMAIQRAFDLKIITFKYEFKKSFIIDFAINKYTRKKETECAKYIKKGIEDGFERLLVPSVTNVVHKEKLEQAHEKSAQIFTDNLQQLLMQKPIKNQVILGFDPGYAHGCKLAVVNFNNEVLTTTTIYPHNPQAKITQAKEQLLDLIKQYQINIIAIGNGTACNESVLLITNLIKDYNLELSYLVTSEDGASVYSASKIAADEFPNMKVQYRSAVSIARRIIDPLAELIKIDPKAIGVGQYQHDIDQKVLSEKVDFCVQSCVNAVGVNVNTASVHLLRYVSGLNKRSAQYIFDYVQANKKLLNRQELKKIKYISEKVFEQAAGFLRIPDGDNWLDNTAVHPESYQLTKQLLDYLQIKNQASMLEQLSKLTSDDFNEIAQVLNSNPLTIEQIFTSLQQENIDVRTNYDHPILRTKVIDWADLEVGMELSGIVQNVTEFGAFVDIGWHNTAFIHKSCFENSQLLINQHVNVVIEKINKEQERISLRLC